MAARLLTSSKAREKLSSKKNPRTGMLAAGRSCSQHVDRDRTGSARRFFPCAFHRTFVSSHACATGHGSSVTECFCSLRSSHACATAGSTLLPVPCMQTSTGKACWAAGSQSSTLLLAAGTRCCLLLLGAASRLHAFRPARSVRRLDAGLCPARSTQRCVCLGAIVRQPCQAAARPAGSGRA